MSEGSSNPKRPGADSPDAPAGNKRAKKQEGTKKELPFRTVADIVETVTTTNQHMPQYDLFCTLLDACEEHLVDSVFKETDAWRESSKYEFGKASGLKACKEWREVLITQIVSWQDQYKWIAEGLQDWDEDELAQLMTKSQDLLEHQLLTSLKLDETTPSRCSTPSKRFQSLKKNLESLKTKEEATTAEYKDQRHKRRNCRIAYRQFKGIIEKLKLNASDVSLQSEIVTYMAKCKALGFDEPSDAQPALIKLEKALRNISLPQQKGIKGQALSHGALKSRRFVFKTKLETHGVELARQYGDIGKSPISASRLNIFFENCKDMDFDFEVSNIIRKGNSISVLMADSVDEFVETLAPADKAALQEKREHYTKLNASLVEAIKTVTSNIDASTQEGEDSEEEDRPVDYIHPDIRAAASPLFELEKEIKKKFGHKGVAYLRK